MVDGKLLDSVALVADVDWGLVEHSPSCHALALLSSRETAPGFAAANSLLRPCQRLTFSAWGLMVPVLTVDCGLRDLVARVELSKEVVALMEGMDLHLEAAHLLLVACAAWSPVPPGGSSYKEQALIVPASIDPGQASSYLARERVAVALNMPCLVVAVVSASEMANLVLECNVCLLVAVAPASKMTCLLVDSPWATMYEDC